MNKILLKKCIAEFIGTFVLVFFACGTAALTGNVVATSLAFGLVIVAMAYSIGRISGCHINPAVSIAFLLEKKMSVKEFFAYIISQILGGVIGALVLFGILKMTAYNFTGMEATIGDASNYVPGEFKAAPIFAAIFAEIILTCVFVFVILHVTDEKSEKSNGLMAGLIIGLTLTLVHLVGIGITGTSVNPARSLATAITSGIFFESTEALKQVFIFILAPLAGGCLAALLHMFLTKDDKEDVKEVKVEEPVVEETKEETKETKKVKAKKSK